MKAGSLVAADAIRAREKSKNYKRIQHVNMQKQIQHNNSAGID